MNVDAIPLELRQRRQWVCWRFEERDGKRTKPPWRPDASAHASADDPTTWGSFEEVLATAEAGRADGVGYVFSADDEFCGVDLDACRNGTGLNPDAAAIVLLLDSYTEWSPSGNGVHVLLRGSLPGTRRRKGRLEMYDRARFFCVTGEHIHGTPETIEERQERLEELYEALFPEPKLDTAANEREFMSRRLPARFREHDRRYGDEFSRLYSGDISGYPSHSEADLALCSFLAFRGNDAAAIDSLFRRSGLMRDKWDERRGETTYGALTIEKALSGSSRPRWDAVGTRSASPSGEEGQTAIASPRPDVVGTRDGTQSFSPDAVSVDLRFVPVAAFAAVDEPGASALVGDDENVLVPEGGDCMFYGDGGAGKTTLMVDLALHLAAGDDWLEIRVGRPARVAIIENEGPRPLFRAKLRRKLRDWSGSPLDDRLLQLEEPWSKVSLDDEKVRTALAAKIDELELDALLLGPVTRSGMNEAGTLQQVRDYVNLLGDVRAASGRRVTFLLAHHENRGGQVSGAWEGAVDTLFHVQAQGNGQTRLYVQKARWSPEHHKQKLQLSWAPGEAFEVMEAAERDDNMIADEILAFVREHGGTGWNRVDEEVQGKGDRLRAIRDNLLDGGRLVNRGTEARMKLWSADDPALPSGANLGLVDEEKAP